MIETNKKGNGKR